ncbi:MAG: DUF72 domain-containing protein [Thermoplasmata archaeon]|nr:DUF72 domain-containing protein [Thermoplasmata archaeon]
MAEPLIGAGGWRYFSGGLEANAKGFRFVEVNANFYRQIPDAFAIRWRARVPPDFVFSVKANREITHTDRLRASPGARAAFKHDVRLAKILRAPYLILETPPALVFGEDQIEGLRALGDLADRLIVLGLEARAYRSGRLPPALARTMTDSDIMDVVDLSQTAPRVSNDHRYTRLFGPGPQNVYEFDDAELKRIDRAGRDAAHAAFAFHGVRMYKDAARLLTFKRTGTFPAATGSRGLASIEEVLRPDAHFPATKEELLRSHGWKVIDIDNDTRSHADRLLAELPDRRYANLGDVLHALAR